MARVTVEDCLDKVESRFELVLLAAQRAKDIASGLPLTIDRNDEKDPVLALREIAKESVQADKLRESLIQSYQKMADTDALPNDEQMNEALLAKEAGEEIKSMTSDTADEDEAGDDAGFSFEGENIISKD